MEGKTVTENSVIITQLMTPQDANISGNVHGGVIMKLIDTAGGIVAVRHARTNVVTASIDRLDFYNPVYIGELVTLEASLNLVGKSSMEVGVRVQSENILTGATRHTASAYLTFVALGEERKPIELPALILETDEQRRRNREAHVRREIRLRERKSEKLSYR